MSFQRDEDYRAGLPPVHGLPPNFNPMFMPSGFSSAKAKTPPGTPPTSAALVTPIFMGNISDRCSNEMLERILKECGSVKSWKRIQGSHGRPQAFGFCEFEAPEGTLRALRLLNSFRFDGKQLVVKVEDKVRDELVAWTVKKRQEEGKEALKLEEGELPSDEADEKGDEEARQKILAWVVLEHPEIDVDVVGKEKKEKRGKKEKKARRDRSHSRRRRSRSRSRRRRRSGSLSSRSSRHSPSPRKRRRSDSLSDSSDSEAEEVRREKVVLLEKAKKYKSRARKWEKRETDRERFYEDLKRYAEKKKAEKERDMDKLRRFLEDYNDEKEDEKYFKAEKWEKRRKQIAKELAEDMLDRQAEAAEQEEARKALEEAQLKEEGEKMETEEAEESSPEDVVPAVANPWTEAAAIPAANTESPSADVKPTVLPVIIAKDDLKSRVHQVFGSQDEDEVDLLRTRKQLKPFEITAEDRRQTMSESERKHLSRRLINEIPTKKEELFAFPIVWAQVDASLIEDRVRPWVTKKITEFIGEPEDSLVDFICQKVGENQKPEKINADLRQILDDDADLLVIKLWRVLVYESEAKRLGISKA